MIPKTRNIIIFVVIAIAIVSFYIFFIKSSPDQGSLVSSSATTSLPDINTSGINTNTPNETLVAKDFLSLLLNVKNIKLDDAIFSDEAFNSLHDSSIVLIADGTQGRPNPFAQFGADLPAAGVVAPGASPSGSIPPANPGTGTTSPSPVIPSFNPANSKTSTIPPAPIKP